MRAKLIASPLISAVALAVAAPALAQTATVFEGARLIPGDGSPAIENSAFVVENNRFTAVGRRGEVQAPAGAARVDLSGKTVMPTLVDMHGHFGFQNIPAGTMSKETFTRANLIDHLQRLAFHGVGAVVGVGDLARPLRHAWRPHRMGRRPAAAARGGRARRRAVPHLRRRHGVAGIGRPGRSVAGRRLLSGVDAGGGARRGRRLRQDEARLHQDLGRQPARHQEDAHARALSRHRRRGPQVQRSGRRAQRHPRRRQGAAARRRRGLAARSGARGRRRRRRDHRHRQGSHRAGRQAVDHAEPDHASG